jgi:hypothetical protein
MHAIQSVKKRVTGFKDVYYSFNSTETSLSTYIQKAVPVEIWAMFL